MMAAVLMMLIFSLTFLSSNSGEPMLPRDEHGDHEQQLKNEMKMALGSRPPRCVNKCMSCRPCTATLVVPPHHKRNNLKATPFHYEGDETYYLLSWKCRCRNKLFQP
ncbi:PREDICTED: EPIDERMAL PATTERNING FACTOR-like protein 8 [Fragaria vesca subsp. vesca]|uniref:EPIDERMAL PATTERNING FACTOR-like protein 8 n=1 Tax=Fragaria vesca subsp. vesca TaxID=101020 RepID=UPI0002C3602F|nr:PREDICTED: EPIDERMAL PATTERNING FACTOR-like protein 8 [Fragaria vesca subsp. vesca]